MSAELRQQLVDIAMEPDGHYRKARNDLAAAEQAVTVLTLQLAEAGSRLALAKAHVRHLRNEFTLRYGEHP